MSSASVAKKQPNAWIKFTASVRVIVKSSGATSAQALTQFCSTLKSKNPDYSVWTSDAVLKELAVWEKPAKSKQLLDGKNKTDDIIWSEVGVNEYGCPFQFWEFRGAGTIWEFEHKRASPKQRAAIEAHKDFHGWVKQCSECLLAKVSCDCK